MAALNKGEIVRINYTARIVENDKVFDTTSADVAKEAGIFNEKYSYAAMPYIIGSGRFFKVLDEAVANAEIGKETEIEIKCEDADHSKRNGRAGGAGISGAAPRFIGTCSQ